MRLAPISASRSASASRVSRICPGQRTPLPVRAACAWPPQWAAGWGTVLQGIGHISGGIAVQLRVPHGPDGHIAFSAADPVLLDTSHPPGSTDAALDIRQ